MAGAAVQTVVILEALARMLQTVISALPCEQTTHVGHFGNKCPKHRAERDHDNMKALNSGRCTVLRRIGEWQSLLLSSVPDRVTRISSRLPCLLTNMSQPKSSAARPSVPSDPPVSCQRGLSQRCLLKYVFVCILDAQKSLCVAYGVPDYSVTWSRSVVACDLNACLMRDKSCL